MVGDAAMLIKKARPSRKNRKSLQGAGRTRFKSNQVPLIPASRGHNYANDLPPPASWFPPVFFFFAIPHNAQPNKYSAQRVPTLPSMFIIFPFQGAYIYPVLRPFYLSFILVVFSHLPGTGSGAFLTSLPCRISKRSRLERWLAPLRCA
jgi:hypothetical protein